MTVPAIALLAAGAVRATVGGVVSLMIVTFRTRTVSFPAISKAETPRVWAPAPAAAAFQTNYADKVFAGCEGELVDTETPSTLNSMRAIPYSSMAKALTVSGASGRVAPLTRFKV